VFDAVPSGPGFPLTLSPSLLSVINLPTATPARQPRKGFFPLRFGERSALNTTHAGGVFRSLFSPPQVQLVPLVSLSATTEVGARTFPRSSHVERACCTVDCAGSQMSATGFITRPPLSQATNNSDCHTHDSFAHCPSSTSLPVLTAVVGTDVAPCLKLKYADSHLCLASVLSFFHFFPPHPPPIWNVFRCFFSSLGDRYSP